MDTRYGVKISKLAVDTRVFPLYEVVNGQYFVDKKGKSAKPVEVYLRMQGRFKHLNKEQIKTIQEDVDRKFDKLQLLAGH